LIDKITFVTLVNNKELYAKSKKSIERQAGGIILDFIPIEADSKGWNAATALNYGIEKAGSAWVVCAHQDVIFPDRWLQKLINEIGSLKDNVAIAGLVGVRSNGKLAGHVKDPHGHWKCKPIPVSVISIDEHVILVRKNSGIRFDNRTPGFHCYGTDITLTALGNGYDTVVIDNPVVHLSKGKLDEQFYISSEWLLKKWGDSMNNFIPTCAAIINTKTTINSIKIFLVKLKRSIGNIVTMCDCDDVFYSEI
jgi:hypothetical protein